MIMLYLLFSVVWEDMAWSFRKRIKVAPGVHLNVSKSGVSTSVGPRGAKITTGPKGTYLHTSIPGTGIYNRQKIGPGIGNSSTDTLGSVKSSLSSSTMEKGPSKSSSGGCFFAFFGICLFIGLVVLASSVDAIRNSQKAISGYTAQLDSLEEAKTNLPKKNGQAKLSSLESEIESTNRTIRVQQSRIEENSELRVIAYILLGAGILGLICMAIIVAPTKKSSKSRTSDLSKKLAELEELSSQTNDHLKRSIIDNYRAHLAIDEANDKILPLLEKAQKMYDENPTDKKKKRLERISEEYNSIITPANSLLLNVDASLSEVEKEGFAELCNAFKLLRVSQRIWEISSTEKNDNRKASAGTVLGRRQIKFESSYFYDLVSEYSIPVFSFRYGVRIYFYPKFVIRGLSIKDFSVYPLSSISLSHRSSRFLEEDIIPIDSKQVGTTYRYVNKDGTPDLRYSANPKIPIMLYGNISIEPLNAKYQFSNAQVSDLFVQAFNSYSQGGKSINHRVKENIPISALGADSVSESYFYDIRSSARRLKQFGEELAENDRFCRLVEDEIKGSFTYNKKELTTGKEKVPLLVWADVTHSLAGLGHSLDLNKPEGLGLLVYNILMIKPDFDYGYQQLDTVRAELSESFGKISNTLENSLPAMDCLFVLEPLLKKYDTTLHNRYLVLLYRFASLTAKADQVVTENESRWLNKIMALKEPENNDNAITPVTPKKQTVSHNAFQRPKLSATEELNSLIGLYSVKNEISSLVNYIKVQRLREERGMRVSPVSYHCVFTGNPGTGKTTVARIVSEIYKELGILKKGHLVETDRSGLVAEYVGQTAVKTNKIIDSALDGILFIDEAYSLVDGGNSDYGKEAIATLLKRMEDDRDRLVVILAGYTDDMKRFIDSNPGLQSRFNRYIEFPNYSAEELHQIFLSSAKKYEYKLMEDADAFLKQALEDVVANKDKNFGNGRFVRNLFEKVVENQANRLSSVSHVSSEILATIEMEDIEKSLRNK